MAELKLLLFTVPVGFNKFFIRAISAGWIFTTVGFPDAASHAGNREASTSDHSICMRHGERGKCVEKWVNLSVT